MSILKLKPSYKDYIWGGQRLIKDYHKQFPGNTLAESWELSCHPDGPVLIDNGRYAKKTLKEYIEICGQEVLGKNCRRFTEFPILIKFIDAKDNLSIQVHPDNDYALKYEKQYGKTEMWYVADCKPGAFLYYGFKEKIDEEKFRKRIENHTLIEMLNKVPVQKGDVLFIEAGTIHAIGKDMVIAEIQQNSNVTYRVYDYGRVDKEGKTRELHIEKALKVTSRIPIVRKKSSNPHIAQCDYFTVDKLNLDGQVMNKISGNVGADSFISILILEGRGKISGGDDIFSIAKGDSLFLPAGSGEYEICGELEALVTSIGEKKRPMRIGVDIGGSSTKIGIIDEKGKLIGKKVIPVEPSYRDLLKKASDAAFELLNEKKIAVGDCVSAGIGVPGTSDIKKGIVLYSNNLRWENVPIVEEMKKHLPMPIYIGNDADAAALGETIAGSAGHCSDVVMITLGTGVGVGVVLDGKIYCGKLAGGCEFGHTTLYEGGKLCTCGRKGCLEAYVSAPALVRQAIKSMRDTSSLMWHMCENDPRKMNARIPFAAAKQGDETAVEVVDTYMRQLSDGIVNVVNVFRPEVVLLGGGISNQGEALAENISKYLKEYCFGGRHGEIPEVKIASLGNDAGMIGAAYL